MSNETKRDIHSILRDGTAIDRAMERASDAAALENKRLGPPLILWRDGR